MIKEADVVRDFTARNKPQIAAEWADVLVLGARAGHAERYSPSGTAPRPSFGSCEAGRLLRATLRPHKVMHYFESRSRHDRRGCASEHHQGPDQRLEVSSGVIGETGVQR